MLKTTTRYAVKKNGKYLMTYQNKTAKWSNVVDEAWLSSNEESTKFFANLTNGNVIELVIIERTLKY